MAFEILDQSIQTLLNELGITPNPGQLNYLQGIINKENLLIVAGTGSGKTFGTIVACLHRIVIERPEPISTIVITPLKALNRDIFRRTLPDLGEKLGIPIAVRHGDTTTSERQKQTKNPPQILITTPELFQAMLPAKILGREKLKNVQTIVIDEIHELVTTKRGIQLSLALERLMNRTKKKIQRIGLSATLGDPIKVLKYLAPNNEKCRDIIIPPTKQLDIQLIYPKEVPPESKQLIKSLHTTEEAVSRFLKLLDIIHKEDGTILLFTNTRQEAEILGYRFNRYNEIVSLDNQINFEVHHSSLSTQSRLRAEKEVRGGNLDIIIATSSLELGIDIGSISLVIQYMSPRRIETLIQRIGRAGHGLDKISRGIIIADNPRDLVESYFIKELNNQRMIEPTHIHSISWDILFHQIVGILLDFGESSIQEILRIINGAYNYQSVSPQDLLPLLEYGRDNHFFYINKDTSTEIISLKVKRKAYQYYYSNLSSIPTKRTYRVIDVGRQARVGQLDDAFVSTRAEKGAVFILNGLLWELLALKEDVVEVRQVKGITDAALPTWEGELIPVSYEVSQKTIDLFSNQIKFSNEEFNVSAELKSFKRRQIESIGIPPSKNNLIIEIVGRKYVIHSFLGSKGNETLGILLSSLIGAKHGHSIQYRSDPYSIFLSMIRPIDLRDLIQSIEPVHILPLLKHRIRHSDLFAWKIKQVAKRFGAISEEVESSPMMTRLIVSRYRDTIIGEETINEILDEKMDLEVVLSFFEQIKEKRISIHEIPVKGFDSPLSTAATQPISLNILKLRPSHLILEKVEKRLNNTWIRLVCMRLDCDYERTQRIESLNDIQCPKCQSRFIAVVHQNRTGLKKLLKRSVSRKEKLTKKEKKDLDSAKKSADIILSFGKKAAFVLAGRGIGPQAAIRILREPHESKEDLLSSIYEAEATFSRTREYWD